MNNITYKVVPVLTDEILELRYNCFNESLKYYRDLSASKEEYDKNSFHILFFVDDRFAGYTRITPSPYNYMSLANIENIDLPNDNLTFEMGRTFVLPEFRGIKLVSLILLIGLHITHTMGYKTAIGNESYEAHLKMPTDNGWQFINIVAYFEMPFSDKGKHKFYLIKCELDETKLFRDERLSFFKNWYNERGYDFQII